MMGTMAPTEKLEVVCKVCTQREVALELVWELLNRVNACVKGYKC